MSEGLATRKKLTWGVSADGPGAVHISMVPVERHAGPSGYTCPSCGAPLLIVPCSKGEVHPHFRAESGAHSEACLGKIAALAALTQLVNQEVLALPAPRGVATFSGVSGRLYTAERHGEPLCGSVASRTWINDRTVRATLTDGRVIHFKLQGEPDVAPPAGCARVDAEVTVDLQDPVGATLEPAEVLGHVRRDGALHLSRHDDLDELERLATAAAYAEAQEHLDAGDILREGGFSPGERAQAMLMTNLAAQLVQRPLIKVAAQLIYLDVPGVDGQSVKGLVKVGKMTLKVSDVRLEYRDDGMPIGLLCSADSGSRLHQFPELRVDVLHPNRGAAGWPERRLPDSDVPLLTLDLAPLLDRGPLTQRRLGEAVSAFGGWGWSNLPSLNARAVAMREQLKNGATEADEDLGPGESESQPGLGREGAIKDYLVKLLNWHGHTRRSAFQKALTVGTGSRSLDLAARALEGLGVTGALEPVLLSDRGVLWQIEIIVDAARTGCQLPDQMINMMFSTGSRSKFATIPLIALRVFQPPMSPQANDALMKVRGVVWESLLCGELTYARPTHLDEILSVGYPELAAELAKPFGTEANAAEVRLRDWQKPRGRDEPQAVVDALNSDSQLATASK